MTRYLSRRNFLLGVAGIGFAGAVVGAARDEFAGKDLTPYYQSLNFSSADSEGIMPWDYSTLLLDLDNSYEKTSKGGNFPDYFDIMIIENGHLPPEAQNAEDFIRRMREKPEAFVAWSKENYGSYQGIKEGLKGRRLNNFLPQGVERKVVEEEVLKNAQNKKKFGAFEVNIIPQLRWRNPAWKNRMR